MQETYFCDSEEELSVGDHKIVPKQWSDHKLQFHQATLALLETSFRSQKLTRKESKIIYIEKLFLSVIANKIEKETKKRGTGNLVQMSCNTRKNQQTRFTKCTTKLLHDRHHYGQSFLQKACLSQFLLVTLKDYEDQK